MNRLKYLIIQAAHRITPHMSKSFVDELEERGYFKGLAPVKAQALKEEFELHGWPAIFSESHRFYNADAEDLAEGGIGSFIREVEPFLASEGVRMPEIQDDPLGEGYSCSCRRRGSPDLRCCRF